MSRLRALIESLPAPLRWGIYGGLGLLLLLIIGLGSWSWIQHREALAQRRLLPVATAAHQALIGGDSGALAASAGGLQQFLKEYPRSRVSAEAWYLLGNVEFQRRGFDAAVAAFEEARRGGGSVLALSLLGLGYAREAKGEPARALEAYNQALAGRSAQNFLYPDLLLAKARAQEQMKDTAGAIESYRRFLKDVPAAPQVEEVRIRLALLGASA